MINKLFNLPYISDSLNDQLMTDVDVEIRSAVATLGNSEAIEWIKFQNIMIGKNR